MLRRWLTLAVVGSVVFVVTAMAVPMVTAHAPDRRVRQPGPLVLVAMPGLSWGQVSPQRTPALWRLAERGAVGAQATMILGSHSCSNASWLTFSAGSRTAFGHPEGEEIPPPQTEAEQRHCSRQRVPRRHPDGTVGFGKWAFWHEYARTHGRPVNIGRVAGALEEAGQCVAAAGGAAGIGAANRDGIVAHYTRDPAHVDVGTCPVTLIGLPGPDDAYLGRLLGRLPADATVVVSAMADETGPEMLHPVVVAGPGVPHGLLTSESTRQPGVVQTTDLSALVLQRLGADAPTLPGGVGPMVRPVHDVTAPIDRVSGLARALDVEYAFVPLFFAVFLGGGGLAVAAGLLWWWLSRRRQAARGEARVMPAALRWWFAVVGGLCAATPMATFLVGLVPWWDAGLPRVALSLGIFGIAVVTTALALLGPWRRWVGGPAAFLAAISLFVIAQDVLNDSRLQFISVMGLQPVYGGRYYGQGNVGYAIFATSGLLLAALLAGRLIGAGHRRAAAGLVAAIGLATVVIDGAPMWGADGGGPLALVPAFAYLALTAAGLTLTWKRAGLIAAASIVIVGGFALVDYLRPPRYRTHLGDFVATFRETHRLTGLADIVTLNWKMLTASWLNASVVLLLLVTLLVLLLPAVFGTRVRALLGRVRFLAQGITAIAVCWLLAFVFNDSGTAIPPTGLLVVAPLLVVLAASVPSGAGVPGGDTGALRPSGPREPEPDAASVS